MKIIECPRDAMQGLSDFIPTEKKVLYINSLLKVGFDTIDVGSFVSATAVPQMRDTHAVLEQITWRAYQTSLLVIVGNARGAIDASRHEAITHVGFPMSLSETFQKRNTNKSILESLNTLEEIKNVCDKSDKKLVAYLSMGFGNPYGDAYNAELVGKFVDVLITIGADVVSLADTIGVSDPENISQLFTSLSDQFPDVELGAHLHSTPDTAVEKIRAAYDSGCKRFDGAIKGYGGCPMAKQELVGNLATETIVSFLEERGVNTGLDKKAFQASLRLADEIFPKH